MQFEEINSFAVKNREAIKCVLSKREKENASEFIEAFCGESLNKFLIDNFDEIIDFIFNGNFDNCKNKNAHLVKVCAIRILDSVIEHIENIAVLKAQLAKTEKEEELQQTDLFFFAVPFFRRKQYLAKESSC